MDARVRGGLAMRATRMRRERRMIWNNTLWWLAVLGAVLAAISGTRAETSGDIKTYYVNGRANIDARLAMESHFAGFEGLQRVPAVDAMRESDLENAIDKARCATKRAWPRSFYVDDGVKKLSSQYMAALSTSLSHLTAIYKAFDDGAEVALILEDDAAPDLMPTWANNLEEFALTLPYDWTVVQLSAIGSQQEVKELFSDWQRLRSKTPKYTLHTLPKSTRNLASTQAYLISRRGMKQLVKAYRAPRNGKINLCAATCVEFEDCILADGVGLDANYRIATPPLFVPRAKNNGDNDSTRQMLYSWAASLSLTQGKAANVRMDVSMIHSVLDEALKLPHELTVNSLRKHFNYHCKFSHGGGARCALKQSALFNQNPPKVVTNSETAGADDAAPESSLGRVQLSNTFDGLGFTSVPFVAMYIIAAIASTMFVGAFMYTKKLHDKERVPILPEGLVQTMEYYA
jgi:GR25 family glycosyltransferase involved in LPS biosynthesis